MDRSSPASSCQAAGPLAEPEGRQSLVPTRAVQRAAGREDPRYWDLGAAHQQYPEAQSGGHCGAPGDPSSAHRGESRREVPLQEALGVWWVLPLLHSLLVGPDIPYKKSVTLMYLYICT